MKTENKLTILFFAGLLACLILAIKFTPTKQPAIEDVLNADTTQINHSEIQVQELGENWIYQHQIEPKYLNND